jgi:hypothetical protein
LDLNFDLKSNLEPELLELLESVLVQLSSKLERLSVTAALKQKGYLFMPIAWHLLASHEDHHTTGANILALGSPR